MYVKCVDVVRGCRIKILNRFLHTLTLHTHTRLVNIAIVIAVLPQMHLLKNISLAKEDYYVLRVLSAIKEDNYVEALRWFTMGSN